MTVSLAKTLYFLCAVAWYVVRYPYERRAWRTPVAISARNLREKLLLACATIGFGVMPLLYVAFHVPRGADRPFVPALAWLGLAVFIAALWLNYRTHRDLGRNFSPSLDVRHDHTLVTRGVYRWVRHPMYAAFFLWGIAQALLLPNWVAGFAGLIGFGVLYGLRVGREERLMLDRFGDEYRAYMTTTSRLVPWIY